jgi:hypothetical protein
MAVTSYSLAISPCEDVAILEAKPDEMISKKPPTKSGEVSTKFVSPSENPGKTALYCRLSIFVQMTINDVFS